MWTLPPDNLCHRLPPLAVPPTLPRIVIGRRVREAEGLSPQGWLYALSPRRFAVVCSAGVPTRGADVDLVRMICGCEGVWARVGTPTLQTPAIIPPSLAMAARKCRSQEPEVSSQSGVIRISEFEIGRER